MIRKLYDQDQPISFFIPFKWGPKSLHPRSMRFEEQRVQTVMFQERSRKTKEVVYNADIITLD